MQSSGPAPREPFSHCAHATYEKAARALRAGAQLGRYGRIEVSTAVWIACPHLIPVVMGVCGRCRALTPPNHHRGSRAGSGPGTGEKLAEGRDGLRAGGEMTETEERVGEAEEKRQKDRRSRGGGVER